MDMNLRGADDGQVIRRLVPLKRRFLQESHGVTFQKTPFFIDTAVKTSSLGISSQRASVDSYS
jgi:hypothetical protein